MCYSMFPASEGLCKDIVWVQCSKMSTRIIKRDHRYKRQQAKEQV